MTRYSPIKLADWPVPTSLECPKCGEPSLSIQGAKLYARSSDHLSVRTTEIGAGNPFVCEQAAGGSGNPSPLGNAIDIHFGCWSCTLDNPQSPLTLALFEKRGQIELAWAEPDDANSEMSDVD